MFTIAKSVELGKCMISVSVFIFQSRFAYKPQHLACYGTGKSSYGLNKLSSFSIINTSQP